MSKVEAAIRLSHKMGLYGLCGYCGTRKAEARDHIIPRCEGGTGLKNNLMPSCNKCNSSKGRKDLDNWKDGTDLMNPLLKALSHVHMQGIKNVERGFIDPIEFESFIETAWEMMHSICDMVPKRNFYFEKAFLEEVTGNGYLRKVR